jgi:hypothetical protein
MVTALCRVVGSFCLGNRPFRGLFTKRTFTILTSGLVALVVAYGCRHLNGSYREVTIAVAGFGALLAIWTLSASVFEGNSKEEQRSY